MKKIIKMTINILLISYTFLMLDHGLYFFALYFFSFITSLLFNYYAVLIVVPIIIITNNIILSNIILSIVALVHLLKFIILKDNKLMMLSYLVGLIIYVLIYNVIYLGSDDYLDLLVKLIFSLAVYLLIMTNLKIYKINSKANGVAIVNSNLYYVILLTLSTFSIVTNNLDMVVLVWLMVFIRSITSDKSFLIAFSLILPVVYVFMYNENTITVLMLFLAIHYNHILTRVLFIIFLLLYNNSYIKIFYLDRSYLILILSSSIFLWVFYKKERMITDKSKLIVKESLNDYLKYVDLCLEELQESSSNKKINKTIEEIFATYCTRCSNYKKCSRKKIQVYNYVKIILTYKIDLNMLNQSKGLNDFAYYCPKFQEFNRIEKIKLDKNHAYDSLLEGKKLVTNLMTKLNEDKETYVFERFIDFLSGQGYIVMDYDIVNFDHLFELYIRISDINENIIKNIIINYASYYFKNECTYNIVKKNMDNISFKIYYKSKVKISFEHYGLAKNNERLPGDNYMVKRDMLGRYIFALSDGMGSGYEAFTESSQMLRLVSKLTNLKLDIKTSVSLLDNFYAYKNDTDMYASLDFLQIDSVNKKASLFKLGSANTYLMSKNKLKILQNTNLPLGLSANKDIYTFNIYKNDLIILLTDGVTEHINLEIFERFLISIINKPINKIVYDILELVTRQSHPNIVDDISVLAIKVA